VSTASPLAAFQVPLPVHLLSGCVQSFTPWWVRLGNLETMALSDRLRCVPIDRPIYVAGIARAGTTILLELLARHDQVATHRYGDFPGQFVPYWWNRHRWSGATTPRERAHADRLQVTSDSPEAMEEPLWMAFFSQLHDPAVGNMLDANTENSAFEEFYRDHLRKLLLIREKTRYVAKGNYNFTRFQYLQKLLPSARFVAVVRNPRDQIASLIKQHRLFSAGEQAYPRALAHMQRVGHFEFGIDRRPLNVGTNDAEQVADLWQQGEEVRGTARYWASIYGWFADRLHSDPQLADSVLVIRYEDLCSDPQQVLDRLVQHCGLPQSTAMNEYARQIAAPDYYAPDFSNSDEEIIAEETGDVAARYEYHRAPRRSRLAMV
jgi:hypothetical protein